MKRRMITGVLAAALWVVFVSTGLASDRVSAQGGPSELEAVLESARSFSGGNEDWEPFVWDFDGVEMVLVPAGCFMMGSTDEQIEAVIQRCETCDRFFIELEGPAHQICFDEPFWIDRTEVTNGQYGSSGMFSGSSRPRESITWFEARDFCESRGARLPTEPEWEYAARGPDGLVYPWGNTFVAANVVYFANSGYATADVGNRPGGTSWVGALDLSGNVAEYLHSTHRPYPYDPADGREGDPDLSSDNIGDKYFMIRGGTFFNEYEYQLRSANRVSRTPTFGDYDVGFRCARSAGAAPTSGAIPGSAPVATGGEQVFLPAGSLNASWTPVEQDFDGATMVLVPAGCFMMGSTDEQIEAAFQQCEAEFGTGQCGGVWLEDERPAHEVCFEKPFWIDKTEVTNSHYGSSGQWSGSNSPREEVTWFAAQDFCESRRARLPTEAEWEYAARGPEGWVFPWGSAFDGVRLNFCEANCVESWHDLAYDDGYAQIAPAGSYSDGASWVGALDMSGNLREWVADWYGAEYYATLQDGVVNPTGPAGGEYRVVRGGSFSGDKYGARATQRTVLFPNNLYYTIGFRCARSVED
ncbi:MAG: SUMF1/EgtB/PvdO family nonheme iron enzyme [Anaerolineae bacterium]|nr:SUMF1/EgtB/PvdO family nonheme iron enzyme [Anaerolineae bacterium]